MKHFFVLFFFSVLALAQLGPVASLDYEGNVYITNRDPENLPTTMWIEIANTSWYNANQETFDITSAEELAGIAQLVLDGESLSGKTFVLTNDIDLGDHLWTPIGADVDFPFSGIFDGNNHTITNLYINLPNGTFVGLFGHIVEAKIENVNLVSAEIYGKDTVGSLIANVYTSEVYNCHADNILIVATDYNIGGLCGSILTGSIMENCSATNVDVTGDSQIGGLLGSVWDTSILRKSYSSGQASGGYIVGGLVGFTTFGFNANTNIVENCYSRTNVSATLGRVGGFYGQVSGALDISNSYATGTATAPEYTGGFVGVVTNMISTNNHFDMETSGHMDAVGGWEGATPMELDITPNTTEFMTSAEFVILLNSQNNDAEVWFMDDNWNDDYPVLIQSLGLTDVEDIASIDVQIYPNPVKEKLNFKTLQNIQSIEIYNSTGKHVMTYLTSEDIDVSPLPAGVYYIKINIGNSIIHNKFIKK